MKYIDPTGKLVIFINGLAPIFKTGGASKYWDGFDKAVMEHLNDNKAMYVNGAVTLNGFGDGVLNYVNNKNSISRYVAGYKYGKVKAQQIFNSLSKGVQIKIISYSMGSAYSKRFIQALVEYMEKQNIDISTIAYEANIAPYQPDEQKAIKGISTLQYSFEDDWVAGDKSIQGADKVDTKSDKKQGHFLSDLMHIIYSLPQGNYKMVNGEIVPQ